MIGTAFLLREIAGPHAGQPVYTVGPPLARAQAALVLLHGRGAGAIDMLGLANELGRSDLACLMPAERPRQGEAAGNIWYPQRLMVPIAENEPWLSSALDALGATLAHVSAAGIPGERACLLGFSQGACLVLEYAARHRRRYGGIIGFAGALTLAPAQTAGAVQVSARTASLTLRERWRPAT